MADPDAGDIGVVNLSPHSGSELAGRHHCVVLTPRKANIATGRIFQCPITSVAKGSNFELEYKQQIGKKTRGYLVISEMKSIEYISRGFEFVKPYEKADQNIINEIWRLFLFWVQP